MKKMKYVIQLIILFCFNTSFIWSQNDSVNSALYVTNSQLWGSSKVINTNVVISSGAVLTITAKITIESNQTITIQNGGKLVLLGGTISNGNVIAESGSSLIINNNGVITLGSSNLLEIKSGAIYNLNRGIVDITP
ncbi:MAG: hypothetical protein PHH72_00665 [Parabacteroides sp.]|nr:hypothetical protein [uncultured Macellibacteroides sp.]MDD2416605.1 hypothetical protein [Parabacteroides sp.]MDD3357517.1 hypothetical protein [Parabacteroides sp.]MDD4405163.1 hypothetical protein [Parabacteroides sp.]